MCRCSYREMDCSDRIIIHSRLQVEPEGKRKEEEEGGRFLFFAATVASEMMELFAHIYTYGSSASTMPILILYARGPTLDLLSTFHNLGLFASIPPGRFASLRPHQSEAKRQGNTPHSRPTLRYDIKRHIC